MASRWTVEKKGKSKRRDIFGLESSELLTIGLAVGTLVTGAFLVRQMMTDRDLFMWPRRGPMQWTQHLHKQKEEPGGDPVGT